VATPDKISFHGAMRPAGANTIPFPRRRSSDADTTRAAVHKVPGGAFVIANPPAGEPEFDQATREHREEAATALESMWQPEQQSPWLLGVYLLGFITGLGLSHIWPWGVL